MSKKRIKTSATVLRVNQRVEILMYIAGLKHRKRPVRGRITNIDGSYILVRPSWCKWVVELYPNEIKVLEN